MTDTIKFPNSNSSPLSSPKQFLISLQKAKSFEEYNNQFMDKDQIKQIIVGDIECSPFNTTSRQRANDYLNKDNAEVLRKNRILIAHKKDQLWSKTAFCQYYKHETVPLFTYGNHRFYLKGFEIAKLWLEHSLRRRYDSYEAYLKIF